MDFVKRLIDLALDEDIGPGDITTDNIIGASAKGKGFIRAKQPLVIAGIDIARQVFEALDSHIVFEPFFGDGDEVEDGEVVLEVKGSLCALLKGERTALNFLQRLSGIATHVRKYVKALGQANIRLVDTRKTTPGWRVLEKYAVRVGGAYNHRMGLYDGILIKDNHIEVAGGIKNAVEKVRKNISHLVKIEVEAEDIKGVKQALEAGADIIMLDNMDKKSILEAVRIINKKALVEISGGVDLDDIPALCALGADIISCGALTHSATGVDLSMRIEKD